MKGRGIFDNIQKFVHYLLSCNAGEVLLMLFAALVGWPGSLLAIQILWINLVTDGLPALALGMEPRERDIMTRQPPTTIRSRHHSSTRAADSVSRHARCDCRGDWVLGHLPGKRRACGACPNCDVLHHSLFSFS